MLWSSRCRRLLRMWITSGRLPAGWKRTPASREANYRMPRGKPLSMRVWSRWHRPPQFVQMMAVGNPKTISLQEVETQTAASGGQAIVVLPRPTPDGTGEDLHFGSSGGNFCQTNARSATATKHLTVRKSPRSRACHSRPDPTPVCLADCSSGCSAVRATRSSRSLPR